MTSSINLQMRRALQSCRRHFSSALLFSALVNLLFIVPMLYMLQVYGRVVPTRGGMTLAMLTLVLLLGLATMSALDTIRSRLLVRAGVRLDQMLARTILDATLKRPKLSGQRLAKQATRELDLLRQALTGPPILAVLDAPWVPIYVMLAFILHPWIGMLAVVGAVLVVLLAIRNEQVTRERMKRANMAAGQTYAELDAMVAGADVVRALGMRDAMITGHIDHRQMMMRLQTEASLGSSMVMATSKFVRQFLQSIALGVGALLAIDGKISPGTIFASMFIVGRALAPIDQVVGNWRGILQAREAWLTLNDLLNESPEDIALTKLARPVGRIEVCNLHIVGDHREAILNNLNFVVEPGQVVAIIGPSGAGKSTLVRALAGALVPDHGEIRIDGADQRSWDPERLAEHIGFMPQEATLFAGTIKENIARFRNRLGEDPVQVDADAIAASQAASAHSLIQRLPSGYDHVLSLGGRGLSAGQGQRVALARAMFRGPSVLILDEPNANLDAEGDQQLAQSLQRAKDRGTTIFLVAHRMSMLPIIDRIMVVREGRIMAFGPRDEVLKELAPRTAPVDLPRQGVA